MTNHVTLANVYTYNNFIKDKYCNKYKSIIYLCNFLNKKRKIM